jgi:hypothetical protein
LANTSIDLTQLDFDSLRDSLIAHLRSQDEFRDYDFESSNLRVLVDLLALNSYKNAFFLNMNLSESFLDSAQLRTSLISHSKELNYLPGSARSASAQVNLSFQGPEATYLLEKGQTFTAIIKSNTYFFSLPDSVLVTSGNGSFSTNLTLYEGTYFSDTYIVDYGNQVQRFFLTNPNVDVSSLTVVVYENNVLQGENYRLANTLLGLNETSKRYFLQQAENEMYEVVFGDGVIGYRPRDGSRVVFDYRVTHGTEGNGAKLFSINFNPGPTEDASQINVQTISASSRGSNRETLESIRYMAPRHFRIQERAVAPDDFSIVLREQFPEISAVSAYGGETLSPPRMGKVVLAIDLDGIDGLPESRKDAYEKFLEDRMGLTMGVIFAEPERTYISVRSRVSYNLNQSTLTVENMKSLIGATILEWSEENLVGFENVVRYSKFCKMIDDADLSVVGNQTDLLVYKKIRPRLAAYQSLIVDFDTALRLSTQDEDLDQPNRDLKTIYSSNFFVNGLLCRFEDDGGGNVFIVTSSDGKERFAQNVGTVDYETGEVKLSNFYVDSYSGNNIRVYARLRDKDVAANKATILEIESDEIILNVTAVRE